MLVALLSGPRLVYRWFKEQGLGAVDLKAILIVGAGKTGEKLARSLLYEPFRGYRPIGFIDDDPGKKGREIHGIRILGHCGQIPQIAKHIGADLVAIAIPFREPGPDAENRRVQRALEPAGANSSRTRGNSASSSITLDGLRGVHHR